MILIKQTVKRLYYSNFLTVDEKLDSLHGI